MNPSRIGVGILLATFITVPNRVKAKGAPAPATAGPDAQISTSTAPRRARIQLPWNIAKGNLKKGNNPVYPSQARAAGISATLVAHLVVTTDGSMGTVEVVSGPPMFLQAVTDTIREWQFRTILLGGQPVEFDTTLAVVFALGAKDEVSIIGAKPAPVPSTVPIEESPVPTSLVLEQIESLPMGSHFTPIADLDPGPVAHPARIKVPADVQEKNLIHRVYATYPSRAFDQQITGTVLLHVIIARDGSVLRVSYISGPKMLKDAAMDAVMEWKYKPTPVNGQPVEVDTTVKMVFSLQPTRGRRQ
jgi:TonB family protein